MHLPDINFWLALAFASHKHHTKAADWFQSAPTAACAFCRLTQQGFLGLATTPKVLAEKPSTLIKAWKLYDQLFSDPRVVFAEEPANLETHWRDYTQRRSFSPKVWNDAYLAAFAKAAFDTGLTQYKGVLCTILS